MAYRGPSADRGRDGRGGMGMNTGYPISSRINCNGCEFEEDCYTDSYDRPLSRDLWPNICYMGKVARLGKENAEVMQ